MRLLGQTEFESHRLGKTHRKRAQGLAARRLEPPHWALDLSRDVLWTVYVCCAVRLARNQA
eukprot:7528527-Lingulodinium_polyedra.AAC.1